MIREEIIKTTKDSFTRLGMLVRLALVLLAVGYLCSGFYTLEQNMVGVLQRFGKVVDAGVEPGIHYALPWPVSRVDKIAVKKMKILEITDFGAVPPAGESRSADSDADASVPTRPRRRALQSRRQRGRGGASAPTNRASAYKELTGLDPYSITGDNNIVNISLAIKYNVTDPVSYLLKVREADALLQSVAAAVTVHALAALPVDEILTIRKDFIAGEIQRHAQDRLDLLGAGMTISFVELRYVNPPENVQPYFNDVINAKVEKIRLLDVAESYRNQKVLEAESKAYAVRQEAESYRHERIHRARGEVERFLAQREEYAKGMRVNRKRIYLDFARLVFPKLKRIVVIDNEGRETPLNVRVMAE